MAAQCRYLAVDVGGTFTDTIASFSDGTFITTKVPSTPPSYAEGVMAGIEATAKLGGFELTKVDEILHATTVATNALLERRGSVCGLLTTRGFRDVLEIGRLRIPRLYEHFYEKPSPLVRRRHRCEVDERTASSGEVLTTLEETGALRVLDELVQDGVSSVAICLINSFANADHERRLAALARERHPHLYVSTSEEVNPEVREYERMSATVVNAYVAPVLDEYLKDLETRLADSGSQARFFIMQANGGLQTIRHALALPVRAIESGPAAGVVAGASLARKRGLDMAITFDVGGTTAKAAFLENRSPLISPGFEVGGEISAMSRLTGAGGYPVRAPTIDIAEVGAGGGSIAWIDPGGLVKVGPRSAGADPGPAAYKRGGLEPTLTDANIVLGYIGDSLAGGTVSIDRDAAERAVQDYLAAPLDRDTKEVAHGIHRIANSIMLGGLRAVSLERGRDVRDATLIAFGGSGPIHAAAIARELGTSEVVVPPAPGVFSARGLLAAPIQYDRVRTIYKSINAFSDGDLTQWISELQVSIFENFTEDGFDREAVEMRTFADLRYSGQAWELTVDVENELGPSHLRQRFEDEHRRSFGHVFEGREVLLVNLRVEGKVEGDRSQVEQPGFAEASSSSTLERPVFFGPPWGSVDTPVIARRDLGSEPESGPLIIAEHDSTIVVPPEATAHVDMDDIVIRLQ